MLQFNLKIAQAVEKFLPGHETALESNARERILNPFGKCSRCVRKRAGFRMTRPKRSSIARESAPVFRADSQWSIGFRELLSSGS